jgi:hypothetical protein
LFVIRAKASPQWGIAEIAKALRARKSRAAVGMAQRLAPFWSHVAGRTEKPTLFAAALKVAAKLKDATTAATLLQPFWLTALAGKVALGLTDLLDAYGIDWCRAIIQDWESQDENELPKGRLAWMESTLAILCLALSETPSGRELAGWVLTKQWEFILDRSRQISKYASAMDIAREMGSLCKPILCVIESSRATRQPTCQFGEWHSSRATPQSFRCRCRWVSCAGPSRITPVRRVRLGTFDPCTRIAGGSSRLA